MIYGVIRLLLHGKVELHMNNVDLCIVGLRLSFVMYFQGLNVPDWFRRPSESVTSWFGHWKKIVDKDKVGFVLPDNLVLYIVGLNFVCFELMLVGLRY